MSVRSRPGQGSARPLHEVSAVAELARLIGAAQAGDRDAYRTLLKRLVPLLRRFIGRQLRNPSDADEVVQETLLTVHTARHTYDPARPFLPWLIAIARRRVIDRIRKQQRTSAQEVDLAAYAETFSTDPANLSEGDWSPRALQEAIDALPEVQRQAITMLKLKEMSLKEASGASGITVATLKVATHRAIKRLRARLLGGSA